MKMNKNKVINNKVTVQRIEEKKGRMQEKSIYTYNKAQIFHLSKSKL